MKKILNTDKHLKVIVVFLFFALILIVFQFITTYKKYSKKEENVYLAFFNGSTQLTEMPGKGNTDNLGFEHAECNNGASVEWNYQNWAPIVTNMTNNKTKCNLYFAPNLATNYLYDISDKDTTTLAYDDTDDENLRYIGKEVNNYIDIGDRNSAGEPILWRIIGVMNNMTVVGEDGRENTGESLVKIIRADNIGSYSWDTSAYGVNEGRGVNEWSQADIMKLINPENIYTKDSEIGNSLYWNKTSGQCYNDLNNVKTTCDFSSTGLTESVKEKIAKVRWNTGTIADLNYSNNGTASYMYQGERSNHNGKEQCASSGGTYCNDKVERHTTWDGYIGLIYPSDYGYAVGGSVRTKCLADSMYNWFDSSLNCKGNDWLYKDDAGHWTMTPAAVSGFANNVYYIYMYSDTSSGYVRTKYSNSTSGLRPVVYLKSDIKIKPNPAEDYGSQSNPFVIEGVN